MKSKTVEESSQTFHHHNLPKLPGKGYLVKKLGLGHWPCVILICTEVSVTGSPKQLLQPEIKTEDSVWTIDACTSKKY